MTTDFLNALFVDFNEPVITAIEPAVEDVSPPLGDLVEIRQEAWTEGFLRGRLQRGTHDNEPDLTARLLTSVHEMEANVSLAVEAAALAVADMLVNSFIGAASGDWSAQLPERVRMVADRVKPAMSVAPRFVLRDGTGALQHFDDLTELSRALEMDGAGEDVTIQWQRGEATISRTALLEDLRQAIIPLTCGLASGQNARQQT